MRYVEDKLLKIVTKGRHEEMDHILRSMVDFKRGGR